MYYYELHINKGYSRNYLSVSTYLNMNEKKLLYFQKIRKQKEFERMRKSIIK